MGVIRYYATHNRFTCHWFHSVIFNFTICWKRVHDFECGATMSDIWSTSIYQGIRDCLFSENANLFAIRWISSIDDFLAFLMKGSGLRSALETVYATVSVRHMSSGKAYSSAICGHFLPKSALLSIMLQECWNELNTDKKNDMKKSMNQIILPYLKMMKYLLNLFLGLSKDK